MKNLRFYEERVYGNILIYPSAEIARYIEKLTGKKTVTRDHLKALKALGFEEIIINKANFEIEYIESDDLLKGVN